MDSETIEKTRKAGKITAEAVAFARGIVKKDMLLLELAEKIEHFIRSQGAQPAFPVNLSINEVAAHATPSYDDQSVAHGLLKVDIGVHLDGFVGDTAFTVDLEHSAEGKKLIEAAEAGLAAALAEIKLGSSTQALGGVIEKAIKHHGVVPINNLTGHSIEPWEVHAGISIPNHAAGSDTILEEGVYAIEPFTTTGAGSVRDGKASGIYHLLRAAQVRDSNARLVLGFIRERYHQLPFCSRWIHKEFGAKGLLGLKMIERSGALYHFPQLIERSNAKVAQAEHTVIITKKGVEVVTL